MKQARDEAARTVADRDAQLARTNAQLALQSADIGRLTEALRSSEATQTQLNQLAQQLRESNDRLVRQNADQSMSITELTNRLEVTERERRFLAEQFTEAQGQVDRLGRALRDMGGDVAALSQGPTGVGRGAPRINGVIRATRDIAGIPYATISVGSADNVVRGMQFNIVDRASGRFLGKLTVDTVEPNESTGRLEGPAIAEIRPGVEVRTQL
jgi:chaperonin cofactor prefoldin